MLVRRIARPLLASSYVFGGVDTLRNPASRVPGARPIVEKVTHRPTRVCRCRSRTTSSSG